MSKRVLLVLTCLLVYATIVISPQVKGNSAAIIAQFHVSGTINGESFTEDGNMTEDTPGIATVIAVFSNIPSGFHPFCLGGCDKCSTCTWNAPAYNGAINFDTVTYGNFNATRHVTIIDQTNTTIGNITIGPIHFIKVNETQYTMDAGINGWYSGPTDIINVGSYEMPMHQEAPGEITAHYTQYLFRSGGPSLALKADTVYTYSGNRALPFDEVKTVEFTDVTVVGLTASFKVTSMYEPLTVVGGISIPVDKFGLLAPYIGSASVILVCAVATAVYVKRVKRRKEKQ